MDLISWWSGILEKVTGQGCKVVWVITKLYCITLVSWGTTAEFQGTFLMNNVFFVNILVTLIGMSHFRSNWLPNLNVNEKSLLKGKFRAVECRFYCNNRSKTNVWSTNKFFKWTACCSFGSIQCTFLSAKWKASILCWY